MRFKPLVLVCGADEFGSAIVHRLFRTQFRVGLVALDHPLTMIRGNTFAQAVFTGAAEVEGVSVRKAVVTEAAGLIDRDSVPIMSANIIGVMEVLNPEIVIDARVKALSEDVQVGDASLVIGIGEGRIAGGDCDIVVNAYPGYDLGRLVYRGSVTQDPTVAERWREKSWLKCHSGGIYIPMKKIGQAVNQGELICKVGEEDVRADIDGVVCGLLRHGVEVPSHSVVGEIDSRGSEDFCYSISDLGRAVSGGVLEAAVSWVADMGGYGP